MKRPWKEAFGLERYGVSTVFEETLGQLEEKGISVGYTGSLQDMDTPEDLQGYRRQHADGQITARNLYRALSCCEQQDFGHRPAL